MILKLIFLFFRQIHKLVNNSIDWELFGGVTCGGDIAIGENVTFGGGFVIR